MNFQKFSLLTLVGLSLWACDPQVDDKSDLGPLPSASFEILAGDTPNDFILRNTTQGAFLTNWELGNGATATGEEVMANYAFMGDYEVKMTTFNRGGSDATTQTLTVTQNDPNACTGNFELLTGCGTKTWKLAPEAEAMHIGPSLNETWWGNSESDVTERACHFDDAYIFNSDGTFEYNNNGDFWADSDGNGNVYPPALAVAVGCHPSTTWPESLSAWDSGMHTFTANDNTLTVAGEGAFMGLYKAGTNSEVAEPQSSVTYEIVELTADRMVLYANHGGQGWRFTFVAE